MSDEFIDTKLARLRAELDEIDLQRSLITVQIDLLLQAKRTGASAPVRAEQRASSGSKRWRPVIMEAVRRYPNPLRIHEVQGIQQRAGAEPATMNNVRSHFFNNSKLGRFYERVGTGEYRATPAAAAAVGVALGSSAKNEDGSAQTEPSA